MVEFQGLLLIATRIKKMCNKSIKVQDGRISTFQKMEKEIQPFWIDEKQHKDKKIGKSWLEAVKSCSYQHIVAAFCGLNSIIKLRQCEHCRLS